jgi:hypothetical protein
MKQLFGYAAVVDEFKRDDTLIRSGNQDVAEGCLIECISNNVAHRSTSSVRKADTA